jgi:hypothetical protein
MENTCTTASLYLTPPLIEVPVPIQESERTCIVCAKGIDFVPVKKKAVSVIFRSVLVLPVLRFTPSEYPFGIFKHACIYTEKERMSRTIWKPFNSALQQIKVIQKMRTLIHDTVQMRIERNCNLLVINNNIGYLEKDIVETKEIVKTKDIIILY